VKLETFMRIKNHGTTSFDSSTVMRNQQTHTCILQ